MEVNQNSLNSSLNQVALSEVSNISLRSSGSSFRLEEHIKLHHLQKLLEVFKSHTPKHSEERDQQPLQRTKKNKSRDEVVEPRPGMLSLQEFKSVISGMLGSNKFDEQMEKLFYKVDTAGDGFIDWDELCSYILLRMKELEQLQNCNMRPFSNPAIIKQIFINKQETTTRSLVLSAPLRVVTISKLGAIGVWSNDLKLLKSYNLANDAAGDQQVAKRRFHTWVTDAVYMRNTQNICLLTSSREIYFYDVSTSIYSIEYCLYALPNVPICCFYNFQSNMRNSSSLLFFGDDTGSAHLLKFHSPVSRLFQKPFAPQQGTQRVYFNDLKDHRQFVTYECIGNIHDETLNRIMYVPESDIIITSSLSPVTSVVMRDMKKKNKSYIFKVAKGVECFDFDKSLNILVTGSLDHLVRIWNPYVVARPIKIIRGHNTGICDVIINLSRGQIISYSKEVVIKVWDIKEHNCLQTLSPKFPSVQTGRIPDHGEFPLCIYQSACTDLLILNCNDCIALYKLGKVETEADSPTTHHSALSGLAYNPLFHQIATSSDDSSVCIWDIETGARSLMMTGAHDKEEITSISFDSKMRRLFTGARDGSIKVWNFQNRNLLHKLESVGDAEVTGVASFQDNTIIAVGWNRKIVLYDDSDQDVVNKKAMVNWKGGQLHQDDILCMAHTKAPNLLVTGSYDGNIFVWNDETQQVFVQLRSGKNEKSSSKEHRSIDALCFLTKRLRSQPFGRAVLISSEAGILFWWCLYGRVGILGNFKASEEGTVLSLTTTLDEKLLITGDTNGEVIVWKISNYCMSGSLQSTTEKPEICCRWKAHETAIVKVEFIEHENISLIVTASTDKTARLWTLEGGLVGTFGQKKKWDITKPKTYCHSEDSFKEAKNVLESNQDENKKEIEKLVEDNKVNKDDEDGKLMEEEIENKESLEGSSSSSSEENEVKKNEKIEVERKSLEEKNVILTKEIKDFQDEKIKLGSIAERSLIRRNKARKDRRNRVEYIDTKVTARFGNICSPFQALTIRETEEFSFKKEMPMSTRMIDKGLKCDSENDLIKMSLASYPNEFQTDDGSRGTTVQRKRQHNKRKQKRVASSNSQASVALSTPRSVTDELNKETRKRNLGTPLSC